MAVRDPAAFGSAGAAGDGRTAARRALTAIRRAADRLPRSLGSRGAFARPDRAHHASRTADCRAPARPRRRRLGLPANRSLPADRAPDPRAPGPPRRGRTEGGLSTGDTRGARRRARRPRARPAATAQPARAGVVRRCRRGRSGSSTPSFRIGGRSLVSALAPEHVHGISEALVAPLGLALLLAARGLARRKRRAWQVAVVLLLSLVALHLQHRFGYGAIATALVAVALLARRSDFDAPGIRTSIPALQLARCCSVASSSAMRSSLSG